MTDIEPMPAPDFGKYPMEKTSPVALVQWSVRDPCAAKESVERVTLASNPSSLSGISPAMSDPPFENKEKLEEEFLAFLHDTHFPQDSIFRGPCFQLRELSGRRRALPSWLGRIVGLRRRDEAFPCYADMAILDLEGREYVALIEFRLSLTEEIELEMAEFFQAILDCMVAKPPVFLVAPMSDLGFRICQLRENGVWQELPKRNFPSHATLVAGHAAEKAVAREAKQGRTLNHFTTTCHALAGALGLISFASIGRLASLTNAQMALLGFAALLAIAPHSLGIRLLNVKATQRLLRGK
jgi:hypothetical protein